jgi:phosphatidylserine decarboxylase
LGEFFTRPLKEGSRPVGDGVVSPVDGVVIEHGPIEEGRLLQVKGRTYSVHRLLTQAVDSERYRDGYFATIYLAPHNYHRIHSPVDGEVREAVLVPGTLWPVNSWSVNNIDGLFTVNERVITQIATSTGEVSVVAVGAFNVGSISVTFDPELRSNSHVRSITRRCYSPARAVKKGEHIGTFHLGSTVVLLFDRQTVAAGALVGIERGEVRMGQSLTTGNTASLKSAEG